MLEEEDNMPENRISPQQARESMAEGAMLVCAYDDEEKFLKNNLEGAISLADFERQAGDIPKDQEIIFYCA